MRNALSGRGRISFFLVTLVALVTFFLTFGVHTVCHASDLSLEYSSGKLSANVSKCSLQKTLEALSKKCGVMVFLDSSLRSKIISVKFDKLPLEDGIKKLVNPYSSAVVFAKRATPAGKLAFHISQLKVFDSGNKNASYILVGSKMSKRNGNASISAGESKGKDKAEKVVPVPDEIKDPAKAAAFHKKVSYSLLRTRISQRITEIRQLENKMRYEEEQKRRQIQQAEEDLNAASGGELDKIRSEISMLKVDLRNSKKRNNDQLNKLQRDLDQMKRNIIQPEHS